MQDTAEKVVPKSMPTDLDLWTSTPLSSVMDDDDVVDFACDMTGSGIGSFTVELLLLLLVLVIGSILLVVRRRSNSLLPMDKDDEEAEAFGCALALITVVAFLEVVEVVVAFIGDVDPVGKYCAVAPSKSSSSSSSSLSLNNILVKAACSLYVLSERPKDFTQNRRNFSSLKYVTESSSFPPVSEPVD